MVVTGTIGYALEEPQGPINIFTIPTKNEWHRYTLDVLSQSSRNGARAIMADDYLIFVIIRNGQHDLARQMRLHSRNAALQFQEDCRQEAQQELKRWGYAV